MQLIDGELNPKQEQDVLCEIHRCYHCLEEYNLEKRFKTYLSQRLESTRKPCPGSMLTELLDQIRHEE